MNRDIVISVVADALAPDSRDAVRSARDAGFDALTFDVRSTALDLTQLSSTGMRDFQRLLSSNQLNLAALRCGQGIAPGTGLDQAVAAADEAIRTASALRAPLVCLDLGPAKDAQSAISPLSHLAAIADRNGVMLAFGNAAASFAVLLAALTAAACPWFGVDLDPSRKSTADWAIDEVIHHVGPLIRHVTASNPVRSKLDWGDIINNLRGASFRGAITIDTLESSDPPRAAVAALNLLRARTSLP